ncbi:hypothetical protein POM88_037309 [Heracleum sosnowskyi]|uniref:Uncharacterized protein n=1 Tax=Heracleum sosnowskyi TaxID=360622 RepID=A0AAD8HRS9_9APIA|nr:hypothetical protein POM88_037309 [Heracleum sosnowskyi]
MNRSMIVTLAEVTNGTAELSSSTQTRSSNQGVFDAANDKSTKIPETAIPSIARHCSYAKKLKAFSSRIHKYGLFLSIFSASHALVNEEKKQLPILCGLIWMTFNVRIENHVEIGANSSIGSGSLRDTAARDDSKIDNLVQIGHNVLIGKNFMLCGQVEIAGYVTVGAMELLVEGCLCVLSPLKSTRNQRRNHVNPSVKLPDPCQMIQTTLHLIKPLQHTCVLSGSGGCTSKQSFIRLRLTIFIKLEEQLYWVQKDIFFNEQGSVHRQEAAELVSGDLRFQSNRGSEEYGAVKSTSKLNVVGFRRGSSSSNKNGPLANGSLLIAVAQ